MNTDPLNTKSIKSASAWYCLFVLSNIWSLIHVKVKQHWGWIKKDVAYKKNLWLL